MCRGGTEQCAAAPTTTTTTTTNGLIVIPSRVVEVTHDYNIARAPPELTLGYGVSMINLVRGGSLYTYAYGWHRCTLTLTVGIAVHSSSSCR